MTTNLRRLCLVVGLVTAGCGAGALLGPDAEQGIEGVVLLGPMCPVQTLDDPCPDAPYQAWIGVRTEAGSNLTRVRSGEDGTFRIGLRPGRYVLDPETDGRFPMSSEQPVEVPPGAYTAVVISYDSGIR
jgi:hypothetical protein